MHSASQRASAVERKGGAGLLLGLAHDPGDRGQLGLLLEDPELHNAVVAMMRERLALEAN